jgi:hypothetical protein
MAREIPRCCKCGKVESQKEFGEELFLWYGNWWCRECKNKEPLTMSNDNSIRTDPGWRGAKTNNCPCLDDARGLACLHGPLVVTCRAIATAIFLALLLAGLLGAIGLVWMAGRWVWTVVAG